MVVCQFFLRGSCRFGANCRNEHGSPGDSTAPKDTSNLFGPDSFDTVSKTMQDDLVKEKPAFYLSVYAPCKNAPNIIDGTDVSPEELRFSAYQARASNTMPQYIANESQQIQQMDSVISSITRNTNEAYKNFYHTRVPLNHPTSTFRQETAPAFGGQSGSTFTQATAFGKSAFGASKGGGFGAFGTPAPAFNQSPRGPGVTAFGPSASAFGASAFGGPSSAVPSTATAFGQAAGFGQPAAVTAFGGSSATTAFGQSGFGAQPATSAFGAPSKFGATAFGGAAAQIPVVSAFGAPSSFGKPAAATTNSAVSAFGQPQSTASAFGKPSAFGQPSVFGQPAFPKPSAFGTNPTTSTPSLFGGSGFGQPAAFGQSAFGSNAPLPAPPMPSATMTSPQPTPTNGFAAFANSGTGGTSFPSTIPASSAAFGTEPAVPTVAAFGNANPPAKSITTVDSSGSSEIYKQKDPWWEKAPKESDLPPELLAAFQAERFSLDLIPHLPPPISLR